MSASIGSGTDLVVVGEQSLVGMVDATKTELAQTTDAEAIGRLREVARAAEIIAKARGSREDYLAAAEVKIWSERRAGELRAALPRVHGVQPRFDWQEAKKLRGEGLTLRKVAARLGVDKSAIGYAERLGWKGGIPGVPLASFEAQLGVSSALAYNWEKLSEIPEERFEELISEAREHDLTFNAKAFLRRDLRSYEQRIEPGIYRLRHNRIAIKWTEKGSPRYRTLKTTDISEARLALAKARGRLSEPPRVRSAQTIGDAYALVRRTLQMLDLLLPSLDPEARQAAEIAIVKLHAAEDELVKAANTFPRRSAPKGARPNLASGLDPSV